MTGVLRSLSAIALCFALSGCLTMQRGNTQAVSIDSDPQGATVEIQPDGQTLETPDRVLLSRKHAHRIRVKKEGFQPETIILERETSSEIFLNIFWLNPLGIAAGFATDMNTGPYRGLFPSPLYLTECLLIGPKENAA